MYWCYIKHKFDGGRMEDYKNIEIAGRNLRVSQRVIDMLYEIEKESEKRKLDTDSYFGTLKMMATYYRNVPDYVLICLEPILEMVKNNIDPSNAFKLFESYSEIITRAENHSAESRMKRMAQESRVKKTLEKRKLFEQIKQDRENAECKMSVVRLIKKHFPEAMHNKKLTENLRQQYYKAIKDEGGVKIEQVANKDCVHQEFLYNYFLDHYGWAKEIDGQWFLFDGEEKLGMPRSRIDAVLNRTKHKEKFEKYWVAHLTRKKKNS